MLRANHGANVGGGVAAGAEAQLFCFRHATRGKFVADGLLDEEPLDGEANLAAICVAAPDSGAGGDVEVGIRENEHGVFAAEFENGGNQALGAGFGNATTSRDASGEQDFVRVGIDQRLADFPAALHDGD